MSLTSSKFHEETLQYKSSLNSLSYRSNRDKSQVLPFHEVENNINEMFRQSKFLDDLDFVEMKKAARVRWACISAKSQREEKKNKNGFAVQRWYNLTKIVPFSTISAAGGEPPSRDGQVINKFTKRSRSRMLQKMRKLNKDGLETPLFVTLTYRENYTDCQGAKKHLNAFFQRFRRLAGGEFRYIWKMEFQKRGAVHFHIAFFLPDEFWKFTPVEGELDSSVKIKEYTGLEAAKRMIQRFWAEVTKKIDGQIIKYSRIKYRLKSGVCRGEEREKLVPDWMHELYGTNVRECGNWRQFMGYIGKYMQKEESEAMKTVESVDITTGEIKLLEVPAEQPTGRFWGFSNNFDFEKMFEGCTDESEIEGVKLFAESLNNTVYHQQLIYHKKRLDEAKKRGEKFYKARLHKARAQIQKLAARHSVNIAKIEKGVSLQYEILHTDSRILQSETITLEKAKKYFDKSENNLD